MKLRVTDKPEKVTNSNIPRKRKFTNSTQPTESGKKYAEKKTTSSSKTQRARAKKRWEQHEPDSLTGFTPGSDQWVISLELRAGARDRAEVQDRLMERLGETTRTGKTRNIKAQVSGVIRRLKDRGWSLEQTGTSYRWHPPE